MTITKRATTLILAAAVSIAPLAALAHGSDDADKGDDKGRDNGHRFFPVDLRGDIHGLFGGKDGAHMGEDRFDDKHKGEDRPNIAIRADGSLSARIDALTGLKARIENNDRLSAGDKDDLTAAIDLQIAFLEDLKDKLAGGSKTSAELKADFKAALADWKGKALAMPKAAITAAADRVLGIADKMDALGAKLDSRIDDARDSGKDVSVSVDAHADFTAKVDDARADANAALDLVAQVSLGTNDADQIKANREKLVSARAKIEDARMAFKDAREDVKTILDDLGISKDDVK